MNKPVKILVTGALGQIGTELVKALRELHGATNVYAAGLAESTGEMQAEGPYFKLDVTNKQRLSYMVRSLGIKQVYHLAAMLSATGEKNPIKAWDLNMQGLINVLEVARTQNLTQVFFPSSIAVFGKHVPKKAPQYTVSQPATMYGITKTAGELLCDYYHQQYGLDIRSIRYPGLISHTAKPGGGTTDYAVDIFHLAVKDGHYTCYLDENTRLPMLYMPDAIRATLDIMAADPKRITIRTGYNIGGLNFTPRELSDEIKRQLPGFTIGYHPDPIRQAIADSWPHNIDDLYASYDWGWKPQYDLISMVSDMLQNLHPEYQQNAQYAAGYV